VFFPEQVVCVLHCCKDSSRQEGFVRVFVAVELVWVQLHYVLPVRFPHLVHFHQLVHPNSLPRVALPQHVGQGAEKHSDMVLDWLANPSVNAVLQRQFSLFHAISKLLFSLLNFVHFLSSTQDNFRLCFLFNH